MFQAFCVVASMYSKRRNFGTDERREGDDVTLIGHVLTMFFSRHQANSAFYWLPSYNNNPHNNTTKTTTTTTTTTTTITALSLNLHLHLEFSLTFLQLWVLAIEQESAVTLSGKKIRTFKITPLF